MDVSAIAALSTDMAAARTETAVQMAVLKKAMQSQGSAILPLIQAATGVSAVSSPDHLGQTIDTYA